MGICGDKHPAPAKVSESWTRDGSGRGGCAGGWRAVTGQCEVLDLHRKGDEEAWASLGCLWELRRGVLRFGRDPARRSQGRWWGWAPGRCVHGQPSGRGGSAQGVPQKTPL